MSSLIAGNIYRNIEWGYEVVFIKEFIIDGASYAYAYDAVQLLRLTSRFDIYDHSLDFFIQHYELVN